MPLDPIDYQQIKMALRDCLREEGVTGETFMASKWAGGVVTIKPGNAEMKSKELGIEELFHKIVMIRDRLRVLEQKINSNQALADTDKVDLQQYITRCYGSLTTFNVLFHNKDDAFVGESKARRRVE
jgi:hypothetical protein